MIFKMITKLECYECGSVSNIRKCTDHDDIFFYLCVDCLTDKLEDFQLQDDEEE